MVNRYKRVTQRVLCLAGLAAGLAIIGAIGEIANIHKLHLPAYYYLDIGIGILISLAIPCLGWYGARERDSGALCVFGACNYCNGCRSCLLMCGLVALAGGLAASQVAVKNCKPGELDGQCTQEMGDSLMKLCRQYDDIWSNVSATNPDLPTIWTPTWNMTEGNASWATHNVTKLINEEHCLGTLDTILSVFVGILAVLSCLFCCSTCFHCASGYYGCQLREMVKEGEGASESEDSESDFCNA